MCLAALPALEWAEAALDAGVAGGFPVVVDCRDMWPDHFVDVVPRFARSPARFALLPLFRQKKRRVLQRAFAISGVTRPVRRMGPDAAGRRRNDVDFVAHHAYSLPMYDAETLARAAKSMG